MLTQAARTSAIESPSADDDRALVAALRAGSPDAAARAWERLAPMVLRILQRYFGPGADQQDLCQEVFLRLFARIDELRDAGALRAFAINICLGVARNELRSRRARARVGLTASGELPAQAGAACDWEAREAVTRLYGILAGAGAEDRALFVIRYVEKLPLDEIGAVMGWSTTTVKRRLARTTRRVEARLRRDPVLAMYVETKNQSKGEDR
ncbi:MAG TPA: sigma-70 family RNA polymerase sigma factor [Polyangia bacterium]|jgi:RNA polymerase sigma-70 factor (ECF subfamily)|nr:sigma-70 family RNA polymerase sigma factor [Polyangia bacterium]